MKTVKVALTEIRCRETHNPVTDEIYVVVAADGKSSVGQTHRRITRDSTHELEDTVFAGMIDEDAPIFVTIMEQRAARDTSTLTAKLEEMAEKGVRKIKDVAASRSGSAGALVGEVVDTVLCEIIDFVKKCFKDSTIATAAFSPYSSGEPAWREIVVSEKSDQRPTYDYDFTFVVQFSD